MLGAAAMLARRAAAATPAMRVGWLRAPNDLTLVKARGTLERALAAQGVAVAWSGPFASAAPALEALNAGALDITVASSTACVTALASFVPLAIFAYQKLPPAAEAILVPPGSPIAGLAGLAGRRVAVNRGGTGEYLLVRAMERAGLSPDSVERVYLAPPDAGPAFLSGHVDAWAIWDPFLTIARRGGGARVLADGAALGSDNAVTTVASRAFAERHRPLLGAVLDALVADNTWALGHVADAGRLWTQAMGLPDADADAIGRQNAAPTHAVTRADMAQLGRVADWYADHKIVPRRPDVAAGMLQLDG